MTNASAALREQLRRILAWEDAHVGFEKSLDGLAPKLRGARVDGVTRERVQCPRAVSPPIADVARSARNGGGTVDGRW